MGESGQSSHAEVFSIIIQSECLFKGTSQLIAAQRGSNQGVGLGESRLGESFRDLSNQNAVGQSLGENLGDLGLECRVKLSNFVLISTE